MKKQLVLAAVLAAAFATSASAQVQGVNLNGRWQCVANCLGPVGSYAFITQNGWQFNVVNDAGVPSRGWVEYPGRIWIGNAWQGGMYSSDGMTIQFDRGTIWQRPPERSWGLQVARGAAGMRRCLDYWACTVAAAGFR